MNVDKVRDILNAIKKVNIDKVEIEETYKQSDTVIRITILNAFNKVQKIEAIKIKK